MDERNHYIAGGGLPRAKNRNRRMRMIIIGDCVPRDKNTRQGSWVLDNHTGEKFDRRRHFGS